MTDNEIEALRKEFVSKKELAEILESLKDVMSYFASTARTKCDSERCDDYYQLFVELVEKLSD